MPFCKFYVLISIMLVYGCNTRCYDAELYLPFSFVKDSIKHGILGDRFVLYLDKNRELTKREFIQLVAVCNRAGYDFKVTLDSMVLIKKKFVPSLQSLQAVGLGVESDLLKEDGYFPMRRDSLD